MTAAIIAIVVVAVLVLLFVAYVLASRSSLVGLARRTDEGWRDIRALLARRAELVPQVVSAVGEYEPGERRALAMLSDAGSATVSAATPGEASIAENHLQQALRTVLNSAAAYPKLESAPAFLQLRSELADSAEQIQASRRFYNGGVREFNAKRQTFPGSLFAKGTEFAPREFFEAADTAARAEPPRVQF